MPTSPPGQPVRTKRRQRKTKAQRSPAVAPELAKQPTAAHLQAVAQLSNGLIRALPYLDLSTFTESPAFVVEAPPPPPPPPAKSTPISPSSCWSCSAVHSAKVHHSIPGIDAYAKTIQAVTVDRAEDVEDDESCDGRLLKDIVKNPKLVTLVHPGPPVGPWDAVPLAEHVVLSVKARGYCAHDILSIRIIAKSALQDISYGMFDFETSLTLDDIVVDVQLAADLRKYRIHKSVRLSRKGNDRNETIVRDVEPAQSCAPLRVRKSGKHVEKGERLPEETSPSAEHMIVGMSPSVFSDARRVFRSACEMRHALGSAFSAGDSDSRLHDISSAQSRRLLFDGRATAAARVQNHIGEAQVFLNSKLQLGVEFGLERDGRHG
ncbi:hypothetical protein EXIGLDRAFT_693179 [Exidia glandulosa HHB12029]|uniref:Uncharacterized protein n=1 Tax=Exidia glandulosa HHB12029 TaxID=1314781 RepID=A0A165HGK9_EXIGL|nr:hypothetical protein EXIGLDRAFT_693179 [Exidia glandulosa HHB12029]